MRTIVVTPTYNERGNLEEFTSRVRTAIPGVHILVVDDNSPDGTGELAEELGRRYRGEVHVLHRSSKGGLGTAYVAGFRRALELDYDLIVQMDADLSHPPEYLPGLLAAIENHDLVLGSRYLQGVNVINWELRRLLLSMAATRYVQLITGLPYSDITGGFKCWRAEALRAVGLDRVYASGYLFQIEMTLKAFASNLSVGEVPIVFHERQTGRSKMDLRIVIEAIWGVWRLGVPFRMSRILRRICFWQRPESRGADISRTRVLMNTPPEDCASRSACQTLALATIKQRQ